MSVGEIAGLIAAIAFVALVALTAVPLLKLGRVLEEVRLAVRDIGHESVPILTELQGTVRATNDELVKLEPGHRGRGQGQPQRDRGQRERGPDDQLCSQRRSADRWSRRRRSATASARRSVATARAAEGEAECVMFRRFFWFAIGAGVAVFVFVKIRQYLKKARPEAIGQRVAESASGISESARGFVDRVRAGMAERETELRETLGLPDDQPRR